MKKKIIGVLKIVVPVLIGIYICWYFWNSFSEDERQSFKSVFRDSNYLILFSSLVFGFISHISRAIRWKYMLKPLGYAPSLKNTYNAVMIGYIANIVIPRMGEASRAGVLKSTDGVPFDKGFGTIISERVIDVLCLAIITGIAILINIHNMDDLMKLAEDLRSKNLSANDGIPWIRITALAVFSIGTIAFIVLFKTKPKFKEKIQGFTRGLWDGLKTIFVMKDRAVYFAYTAVIWGCYVLMFWVTFYAWEGTSDLSPDVILSAFIAGTIGFIVMQGGIGTFQVLVATVLTFFIAPEYLAEHNKFMPEHFGFATLVWLTQTILVVVLGLVSLVMVQSGKVKEK